MSSDYPYPREQEDGYEFQVVEQDDADAQGFLAAPLPNDDRRFSVSVGDTVKLVFLYRDSVEKNGQSISAEHMWVEVIELCENFLRGRLDSAPQYSSLFNEGAEVRFHPKHIVNIWEEPAKG